MPSQRISKFLDNVLAGVEDMYKTLLQEVSLRSGVSYELPVPHIAKDS